MSLRTRRGDSVAGIEHAQVRDVEGAVVKGDRRRNDVTLAGRNVDDAVGGTVGSNSVEFAVIWLDDVEVVVDGDHAVGGAVGFEVTGLGVLHGVCHVERAEVVDQLGVPYRPTERRRSERLERRASNRRR